MVGEMENHGTIQQEDNVKVEDGLLIITMKNFEGLIIPLLD